MQIKTLQHFFPQQSQPPQSAIESIDPSLYYDSQRSNKIQQLKEDRQSQPMQHPLNKIKKKTLSKDFNKKFNISNSHNNPFSTQKIRSISNNDNFNRNKHRNNSPIPYSKNHPQQPSHSLSTINSKTPKQSSSSNTVIDQMIKLECISNCQNQQKQQNLNLRPSQLAFNFTTPNSPSQLRLNKQSNHEYLSPMQLQLQQSSEKVKKHYQNQNKIKNRPLKHRQEPQINIGKTLNLQNYQEVNKIQSQTNLLFGSNSSSPPKFRKQFPNQRRNIRSDAKNTQKREESSHEDRNQYQNQIMSKTFHNHSQQYKQRNPMNSLQQGQTHSPNKTTVIDQYYKKMIKTHQNFFNRITPTNQQQQEPPYGQNLQTLQQQQQQFQPLNSASKTFHNNNNSSSSSGKKFINRNKMDGLMKKYQEHENRLHNVNVIQEYKNTITVTTQKGKKSQNSISISSSKNSKNQIESLIISQLSELRKKRNSSGKETNTNINFYNHKHNRNTSNSSPKPQNSHNENPENTSVKKIKRMGNGQSQAVVNDEDSIQKNSNAPRLNNKKQINEGLTIHAQKPSFYQNRQQQLQRSQQESINIQKKESLIRKNSLFLLNYLRQKSKLAGGSLQAQSKSQEKTNKSPGCRSHIDNVQSAVIGGKILPKTKVNVKGIEQKSIINRVNPKKLKSKLQVGNKNGWEDSDNLLMSDSGKQGQRRNIFNSMKIEPW